MYTSSFRPPLSTTSLSCKNELPTTFISLLAAVTPNFHSMSTSGLTIKVCAITVRDSPIRLAFQDSKRYGDFSFDKPTHKYKICCDYPNLIPYFSLILEPDPNPNCALIIIDSFCYIALEKYVVQDLGDSFLRWGSFFFEEVGVRYF